MKSSNLTQRAAKKPPVQAVQVVCKLWAKKIFPSMTSLPRKSSKRSDLPWTNSVKSPLTWEQITPSDEKRRDSPESGPWARLPAAADGSLPQWPASPNPAHCLFQRSRPGRTSTILRLRPAASPFGRVFIVKVSLNDNEYSSLFVAESPAGTEPGDPPRIRRTSGSKTTTGKSYASRKKVTGP